MQRTIIVLLLLLIGAALGGWAGFWIIGLLVGVFYLGGAYALSRVEGSAKDGIR